MASHVKVGRNDPCPCGSGKKYKHCCEGKRGKLTPLQWAAIGAVVVAAGVLAWVVINMATGNTGADYLGDRTKYSTAKSSTMKGAIEYVRERLLVRL